ncbi:MAG: hypothetical protein KGO50_19490, partial [Myxococcales bacterium]|nr:hypothetical protein [Myxococcales bacterium]
MAKCVLLLTNPDPLTLDAAVQVMGREPDEHDILQHEGHELWGWTPERIRVRRWLESETFDVL